MPPFMPSLKVKWAMTGGKIWKGTLSLFVLSFSTRLTYIEQQCPLSRPLIDLTLHNIRFCNIIFIWKLTPLSDYWKIKCDFSKLQTTSVYSKISWATKVDSLAHSQLLLRDVLLSLGTGKQSHWTFQSLNNVFLSSGAASWMFSDQQTVNSWRWKKKSVRIFLGIFGVFWRKKVQFVVK